MDQKESDKMLPLEHHWEDDNTKDCQELKEKIRLIVFKIREKKESENRL